MLELRNISFKRDNKQILDNVSLKLDDDKFVVITGPNGSGKSTLAKIIMGIEKPDSGEILLDGEDITNLPIKERAKKGIGFAFQQPVRFKGITVFDLIKLSARRDINKGEACNILSKVGLCANEYVDREVNAALSGGELKRIEIASVAMKNSKVNVFDEPEAGIDLWSFNNLIKVFTDMRASLKGTTIIISHHDKIINIADELILLANGKVEKMGSKEEMFDKVQKDRACCKLEEVTNG